MNRQTTLATPQNTQRDWYVIDATDQTLGRLSVRLATILMGKHKPEYTPHVDTGDFVVVTNVDKIKLSGTKPDKKFFNTYSGHPGGRKTYSYRWMMEHRPIKLLEASVRRMLPKNKLAASMLKKLKAYEGANHPHAAQEPKPLSA